MIDVKDIRIGNLFKWKSYASSGMSPVEFIENRSEAKTIFNSPSSQLASGACGHECTPIEVTEDILIKLGFEKFNIKYPNNMSKWVISDSNNNTIIIELGSLGFLCSQSFVVHKYVHELQNIFNMATKEELFYNP